MIENGCDHKLILPSISSSIANDSVHTPQNIESPNTIKRFKSDGKYLILIIDNLVYNEDWFVTLYTDKTLFITEAYIDGSDHKLDYFMYDHNKYLLHIPQSIFNSIVDKNHIRISFNLNFDISKCFMCDFNISGHLVIDIEHKFDIEKKTFSYYNKNGFNQHFNQDPNNILSKVGELLTDKYSDHSIQTLIENFNLLHELKNTDPYDINILKNNLYQIAEWFNRASEIADEKMSPLIHHARVELQNIDGRDRDKYILLFNKLYDELVELLYDELNSVDTPVNNYYRNDIAESNKSQIYTEYGEQYCEEGSQVESNVDKLCEVSESEAQMECDERLKRERKEKEEQEKRLKAEQEKKAREEECKRKEAEDRERKAKEENSIGMKFTLVPVGEFMMGSDGGYDDEKPVHKVTISKPFYLGTYPVTQSEWKAVMGDNPSRFKGDDLPVDNVSWDDVQNFIKKLNQKEGTDKYRLPSEAEWEYSCCAGRTTEHCFDNSVSKYVWYSENSDNKIHSVGLKKPNHFGLYDMQGSIWEWIEDRWHENYVEAPSDGSVWNDNDNSFRVIRGGSFSSHLSNCRATIRLSIDTDAHDENLGFRLFEDV